MGNRFSVEMQCSVFVFGVFLFFFSMSLINIAHAAL